MLRESTIESPIGRITVQSQDGAVVAVRFDHIPPPVCEDSRDPVQRRACAQLREYFAGERRVFDLPLRPLGGTPWQQRVWTALRVIPFGDTESYGALAARIGAPKSARAVGSANHCNPLGIVVPCHRVIGADGSLTGYAGGLDTKRWLLMHELRVAQRLRAADVATTARVASPATR